MSCVHLSGQLSGCQVVDLKSSVSSPSSEGCRGGGVERCAGVREFLRGPFSRRIPLPPF